MMRKRAILCIAALLAAAQAAAQVPNGNVPAGPYNPNNPNLPPNAPDLQQPPPCGAAANLASNEAPQASRGAAAGEASTGSARAQSALASDANKALADTQCAGAAGPAKPMILPGASAPGAPGK
jgi:hypothetical protein